MQTERTQCKLLSEEPKIKTIDCRMRIPSFGEFVETQKTAEQASPSFNKSKLKKNEKTKKKRKTWKTKINLHQCRSAYQR